MRDKLESYFRIIVANEAGNEQSRLARVAWRMSCYDAGLSYVDFVRDHFFGVEGKQVLDVACAWGGHAVAFASRGASVLASDTNDHRFDALSNFSGENGLTMRLFRAGCESLPIGDGAVDVVLALELVEHIDKVEPFAREVARVLRAGGLCILSTPSRMRSVIEGEPHYKVKGLTLLPFWSQRWVATRLFGRSYPYPITRQYLRASSVIQPFKPHGLQGSSVLRGRLAQRHQARTRFLSVVREFFWNFIVLEKPGLAAPKF